jgi:hypothetical protein
MIKCQGVQSSWQVNQGLEVNKQQATRILSLTVSEHYQKGLLIKR